MKQTYRNVRRLSRPFAIATAAGFFIAACGGSESSDGAATEPDEGQIVIVDADAESDPGDIVVVEDAAPPAETNTQTNAETDAPASDTGDDPGADIVVSTEGADSESASDVSEEELALQFAQCMRDEGIDEWPDPTTNADGSIDITGGGAVGPGGDVAFGSDEVQAAIPTCGPIIAGASFLPNNGGGMTTETQDQLLAFAQCLRDEGIDVSDPDLSNGAAGLLDWEFDPEDPANADAIEACQTLFAGAVEG